jgi:hypothetical protein
VVDRNAVVSATSTVSVATSNDLYFDSDSIAIRANLAHRSRGRPARKDRMFTITQPGS